MIFALEIAAVVVVYAAILVAVRLAVWRGEDRNRRLSRRAKRGLA